MHQDVVLDFDQSYQLQVATISGLTSARFPFLPVVRGQLLDARSAPFFRLREVVFPFASSLDVDLKKQPRAITRVLAQTSNKSTRLTDANPNLKPFQKFSPSGPESSASIAMSVEGP